MPEPSFTTYVAIGDSMSIDLYAALDAGEVDVAVALERVSSAGHVAPLGAASLLYRNAEERWPEHVGDDLSTVLPGLTYTNLATDGATIGDVFGEQLERIEPTDAPALVTLTIGSSDLWSAAGSKPRHGILEHIVRDLAAAYGVLVGELHERLPNGTVLLTTVTDPSDRTAKIPGVHDGTGALPLGALDSLNDAIRKLATSAPRAVLADAYAHFLGHGVSAAEDERWYWRRSLIELNARGASELRDLWLSALRQANLLDAV